MTDRRDLRGQNLTQENQLRGFTLHGRRLGLGFGRCLRIPVFCRGFDRLDNRRCRTFTAIDFFTGALLPPCFDDLGITHHLDARTIGFLRQVCIPRPQHLLHLGIETVMVRGAEQYAAHAASRHAYEYTGRRLTRHLLHIEKILHVAVEQMRPDILFRQRGHAAHLTLE